MYLVTFYHWLTINRNNKQHFNVLTTEQRRHTHTHTQTHTHTHTVSSLPVLCFPSTKCPRPFSSSLNSSRSKVHQPIRASGEEEEEVNGQSGRSSGLLNVPKILLKYSASVKTFVLSDDIFLQISSWEQNNRTSDPHGLRTTSPDRTWTINNILQNFCSYSLQQSCCHHLYWLLITVREHFNTSVWSF